jgi:hypothetical protein
MADTVAVNFRVMPETVERMEQLCRQTFRSKGDLVDWAISVVYESMNPKPVDQPVTTTPAEVDDQMTKAMILAAHAALLGAQRG